jgi:hypothetical protein
VQFGYSLPWWVWLLVVAGAGFVAFGAYTRTLARLSPRRRSMLIGLRFSILLLLVVVLARPTRLVPSGALRNRLVPVLVDVSRSMAMADADGQRRIDRAAGTLQSLIPRVSERFQTELLTFDETIAPGTISKLSADGRRSDLTGALRAVQERYRGRALAGIVVISDGGDTGERDVSTALEPGGPAVFTVGVGRPSGQRDREVLGVTAGDASVVDSLVDLTVSAVSRGFGTAPFELRVLANGRPIDARQLRPTADGSPIHEVFLVAPDRTSPTLYTVEIPAAAAEITPENNSRSMLVRPPGRPRRVLLIEGAPGFEQSFLKRAWDVDPGLEVDSIVKKGQNDQGANTYLVQAAAARTGALTTGFPNARDALFAYDAVVLANIGADSLTRDQLTLIADFVAERGGGLLVLGAQSFRQGGLIGTALEEVLPVELSDRQGGLIRASQVRDGLPGDVERSRLVPTREGEQHPVTRLGRSPEETRQRWAALPALPYAVLLGGPRPGAHVLAVTGGASGSVYPMLAVQRYGQGRAMVFAGEASWRWKMMMPATDRTYETFWRQVARWLTTGAPDAVTIRDVSSAMPGDTVNLDVLVRDGSFMAIPGAIVALKATAPDGGEQVLNPALADAASGTYRAALRVDRPGVYRVSAQARRGPAALESAEQWFLVGGADPELSDARLNEDVLRRIAAATGGRYERADEADTLPRLLEALRPEAVPPERRDLWNNAWMFMAIVLLLSIEWVLRRRWGMR